MGLTSHMRPTRDVGPLLVPGAESIFVDVLVKFFTSRENYLQARRNEGLS